MLDNNNKPKRKVRQSGTASLNADMMEEEDNDSVEPASNRNTGSSLFNSSKDRSEHAKMFKSVAQAPDKGEDLTAAPVPGSFYG